VNQEKDIEAYGKLRRYFRSIKD